MIRFRMTDPGIDPLLVNRLLKGIGVRFVGNIQISGGGQPTAVHGRCGDGPGVKLLYLSESQLFILLPHSSNNSHVIFTIFT